jgi:hypothetical protein
MIPLSINQGMADRRSRGPQRPGDSEGRHALLLNEPEQLRGPLMAVVAVIVLLVFRSRRTH